MGMQPVLRRDLQLVYSLLSPSLRFLMSLNKGLYIFILHGALHMMKLVSVPGI